MSQKTDLITIPDALTNYDSFPDSAHVRLPVVQALIGCSSATIWRMVKRGTLPAPRKLSERVTAWNVGDLRKALAVSADTVQANTEPANKFARQPKAKQPAVISSAQA